MAEEGQFLNEILTENIEHPCGGRGVCGKCRVKVDGESVLSCQYKIESDITVEPIAGGEIYSYTGVEQTDIESENTCLCLDLGTTTLALALVSTDSKCIAKVLTATNPQRICGADIISRIDYCNKNGTATLQNIIISQINKMIEALGVGIVDRMYVSANTTMLHILFGADCSGLGVAPYKASFLNSKTVKGEELGIKSVGEIISLASIHCFAGADVVAGLNYTEKPDAGKYNLLVDLGTNAEIVLYSREKTICTSAAAGPCFEGVNISCGVSAVDGAVFSYDKGDFKTIGNKKPIGLCGTGLVDVVACLLSDGTIDKTGYMQKDFEVVKGVVLTQADVREYQLAKSAIFSAITVLLNENKVCEDNIQNVYVSGGFSEALNVNNAVKTGLLPTKLASKCVAISNSSLLGAVKYACNKNNLEKIVENAEYIDLSSNATFSQLFIENIMFF